jgi:hypothetical protein
VCICYTLQPIPFNGFTNCQVDELEYPRGGNEAAALVWLKGAPEPGGRYHGRSLRPRHGDDILVFKQFVVDCYERALFKTDDPLPMSSEARSTLTTTKQPVYEAIGAAHVSSVAEPNLLDFDTSSSPDAFGGFADFPPIPSITKSTNVEFLPPNMAFEAFGSTAPASSFDLFFPTKAAETPNCDLFGDFTSAPLTARHNDPFLTPAAPLTMGVFDSFTEPLVPDKGGLHAPMPAYIASPPSPTPLMLSGASAISEMGPQYPMPQIMGVGYSVQQPDMYSMQPQYQSYSQPLQHQTHGAENGSSFMSQTPQMQYGQLGGIAYPDPRLGQNSFMGPGGR